VQSAHRLLAGLGGSDRQGLLDRVVVGRPDFQHRADPSAGPVHKQDKGRPPVGGWLACNQARMLRGFLQNAIYLLDCPCLRRLLRLPDRRQGNRLAMPLGDATADHRPQNAAIEGYSRRTFAQVQLPLEPADKLGLGGHRAVDQAQILVDPSANR